MNMFRVTEGTKEAVNYEVTGAVVQGKSYRISPSYGYAGITPGVVIVHAILSQDDINDLDTEGDDVAAAIHAHIKEYKRIELDMRVDRDGNQEPDYDEAKERLDSTLWVVYYYPHESSEQGEYYAFPIEDFVDHTSML